MLLPRNITCLWCCCRSFADINECELAGGHHGHHCHSNTECINTVGSYYCQCLPGFEQTDSYTCQGMLISYVGATTQIDCPFANVSLNLRTNAGCRKLVFFIIRENFVALMKYVIVPQEHLFLRRQRNSEDDFAESFEYFRDATTHDGCLHWRCKIGCNH